MAVKLNVFSVYIRCARHSPWKQRRSMLTTRRTTPVSSLERNYKMGLNCVWVNTSLERSTSWATHLFCVMTWSLDDSTLCETTLELFIDDSNVPFVICSTLCSLERSETNSSSIFPSQHAKWANFTNHGDERESFFFAEKTQTRQLIVLLWTSSISQNRWASATMTTCESDSVVETIFLSRCFSMSWKRACLELMWRRVGNEHKPDVKNFTS